MSDAHREEIEKLESLYAQNPEGRIFTHLAEAYRKAGSLEEARDVLTAGIERHPDYSSAHVVLGRVLHDLGQHARARAEFIRVLELDGQNLVALRSLGDIARNEGRDEEALKYYQRLADQEPADDEVREIIDVMTGVAASPDAETHPEGAPAEAAPAGEALPPLQAAPPDEELPPLQAAPPDAPPASETPDTVPAPELEPLEEDWNIDETAGAEWETAEEPGGWEPDFDEPDDEEPVYGEPAGEEALEEPIYEGSLEEPVSDEAPGEPEYVEARPEGGEEVPPYSAEMGAGSAEETAEDDWEQWDEWGFEEEPSEAGAEPAAGAAADGAVEPPVAGEPETAWWEPEPVAEGPAGEDDVSEVEEIEDADVKTETIAQVYARQGLYDRAVEVYQELIRSRPDDEGLRARLAELEQLAGEPAGSDAGAAATVDEEVGAGAAADEGGAEPGDWARNEYIWEDEWTDSGGEAAGATEAETPAAGPGETETEREPWAEAVSGESPEHPEGFEAAEFAAEPDQEVAPVEGLEAEEVADDTGLVVTPGDAEAGADEGAQEPEFEPAAAGAEEEPPTEERAPWEVSDEEEYAEEEAGEPMEAEAHESPWVVEDDWGGETEAETPYAWAEEEAEPEDGTPPIHDYLSGVLQWGGGVQEDGGAPAVPESAGAAAHEDAGPAAPEAEGAAAPESPPMTMTSRCSGPGWRA
jgi:tetratricopeptide (TPR) repeat protein